jgi:hypothetical protein
MITIVSKPVVTAGAVPRPTTFFDENQVTETTLTEAALYGLELREDDIRADFRRLKEEGLLTERSHIVLSLPASVLPLSIAIMACDRVQPEGVDAAYIERNSLTVLADAANNRKVASLRVLPAAPNWRERQYGSDLLEPIGRYYEMSQEDQVRAFEKDAKEFRKVHKGFSLEQATVQEIVSAITRQRIEGATDNNKGQVFGLGWYRTTIAVSSGDGQRRLCVSSVEGQLRVFWFDWLDASAFGALALSAGAEDEV